MRKNLKGIVWLCVPMVLAVGCAPSHRDSSVSYSPALTESYAPTSDRDAARVYPEAPVSTEATSPPPGANRQDWQLAEEVRSLLISDRTLGEAPMAAVVKNGVVTLRGGVRNKKERQRLRDEISRLAGVQRVDDEMDLKNPLGIGPGESKNY